MPRTVSNAPKILLIFILNMHILQVMKKPKCLEKPNDNNNHNHNVEDLFDLSVHGDVGIYKP